MRHLKRLLTYKSGLLAALVGVAALGTAAATTLGATAFSAQVGGTANNFQTGTLLLSKTVGSTTCLSSSNSAGSIATNINSTCTGSDLGTGTTNVIGVAQNATVTLTNQGSVNASTGLSLTVGSCTIAGAPYSGSALDPLASGSDSAANFCGDTLVTIENETGTVSCLYPAGSGACPAIAGVATTLTTLAGSAKTLATTLASGASEQIKITTELGTSASNADQGLLASLPMTYTLNQ